MLTCDVYRIISSNFIRIELTRIAWKQNSISATQIKCDVILKIQLFEVEENDLIIEINDDLINRNL